MTEARHSVASATWGSMDADLLKRVRKTSIIVGLVVAVPFATYFGLMPAAGWLAGGAWSLANLAAIGSLVRRVLTMEPRDVGTIVFALTVKFPILYAAAVGFLVVTKLPVMWWVAGFSWPFFVAIMKAAGRLYIHLDETA